MKTPYVSSKDGCESCCAKFFEQEDLANICQQDGCVGVVPNITGTCELTFAGDKEQVNACSLGRDFFFLGISPLTGDATDLVECGFNNVLNFIKASDIEEE